MLRLLKKNGKLESMSSEEVLSTFKHIQWSLNIFALSCIPTHMRLISPQLPTQRPNQKLSTKNPSTKLQRVIKLSEITHFTKYCRIKPNQSNQVNGAYPTRITTNCCNSSDLTLKSASLLFNMHRLYGENRTGF